MSVDPYATQVLRPDVHGRLVAGLNFYAADAGIAPHRLWTSFKTLKPSQAEIDYITGFRRHHMQGISGLVLAGVDPVRDISDTMALMAAALVRNFVRARVMPLEGVFMQLDEHGFPEHTCLLIPDFHLETTKIPSFRIGKLVSLLLHRHNAGLQTVIYVSSMDDLKLAFGGMIARHIETHYIVVTVD